MALPVGAALPLLAALLLTCGPPPAAAASRPRRLAEEDCRAVRTVFAARNVTEEVGGTAEGPTCGGKCCSASAEAALRAQGRRDLATLLRHNSMSIHGLLHSTAHTLHKHVSELAQQSENKTRDLFSTVYKAMAVLARQPIEAFYRDIRQYIQNPTTDTKATSNPDEIVESTTRFFTDIFPLALHYSIGTANTDFTPKYKQCLKENIDTISPFGEIPKQVAQDLSKSLEATRLLLQAFNIGIEVLNTTDTLLIDEEGSVECHDALLKMTYCPKCQGLTKNSKPCAGYCLNVLRGCVARYVAELDKPWNGYVEGIESLVNAIKRSNNDAGVNADLVIRDLSNRISSAIMHFMEKIKDIAGRVKQLCKAAEFAAREEPPAPAAVASAAPPTTAAPPTPASRRSYAPLPEPQLAHFVAAVARTRGFYATLADTLCKDAAFAEQHDRQCWNGERVAEYTKTVVDVGLGFQKYNPEVKPPTDQQNVDPRIEHLVDKLRHVHHMAQTSLGPNFSDSDYNMQQDGVDGSGSGHGPDAEDDDDEYARGSGNGRIDTDEDEMDTTDHHSKVHSFKPDKSVPRTNVPTVIVTGAGSTALPPALSLYFLLTVLATRLLSD